MEEGEEWSPMYTPEMNRVEYGRLLHASPKDHGFNAAPRVLDTARGPEPQGMYLVPKGGIKPTSPRDRV